MITTSQPGNPRLDKQIVQNGGFTLAELLIVLAVSGLILAGVWGSYLAVIKGSFRLWSYDRMERQATLALDEFGRDVRTAKYVNWSSAQQLTLILPPPVGGGSDRSVIYAYDSNSREFRRTEGGNVRAVVTNVESLNFQRFNRKQATAVNDYETDQIQVNMVAAPPSTRLLARTSKQVLSARFVLRNH